MIKYELSYWEWDQFFRDIDFLIIGGGIVGLSAAIRIKETSPEAKVVVMDRASLPLGASTRNAGFACFGSMTELLDDLQTSSREEVQELVKKRFTGLQLLRQRFGDEAIGYEGRGGYEIFRPEERVIYARCLDERARMNELLAPITGTPDTFTPVQNANSFGFRGVEHVLLNQAEGQLHTGRLMRSLLHRAQTMGIEWQGGVTVTDWTETASGVVLQTAQGWELMVSRVLIATNGFAQQLLPEWEVAPARNQVLITKPLANLPFRGCFHYDRGYYYFRNVGQRILLGGGRHLDKAGETTTELAAHEAIRSALRHLLQTLILPDQSVEVDRWWTGIMGVGQQKTPLISAVSDRVVAAVRLGGMGVALGTWVGESGAQLILGEQ